MNQSGFRAPNANNQGTLDQADASYLKVAIEFRDFQYAEATEIYEALMDAWSYIIDSLNDKPIGY
jgi:hypothetical protein